MNCLSIVDKSWIYPFTGGKKDFPTFFCFSENFQNFVFKMGIVVVIKKNQKKGKTTQQCVLPSMTERVVIGKLYSSARLLGWKRDDISDMVKGAGYRVSLRTLTNWEKQIVNGDTPGSQRRNSGRIALLDDKMQRILVGHILKKNEEGEIVSRNSVKEFIFSEFGIKLTEKTVGNYLKKTGFSLRLAKRASGGLEVDLEKLGETYRSWLADIRSNDLIPTERCSLGSIDATYTRHTTSRIRSYSPRGW